MASLVFPKEPPRVCEMLRAAVGEKATNESDLQAMFLKRKKFAQELAATKADEGVFSLDALLIRTPTLHQKSVRDAFASLTFTVSQILGGDTTNDVVRACSHFLFQNIHKENSEDENIRTLKTQFPTTTPNPAQTNSILSSILRLQSFVPPSSLSLPPPKARQTKQGRFGNGLNVFFEPMEELVFPVLVKTAPKSPHITATTAPEQLITNTTTTTPAPPPVETQNIVDALSLAFACASLPPCLEGSIDPLQFAVNLITTLKKNASVDALQGEVLDCVGFDHIELCENILKNRTKIVSSANALIEQHKKDQYQQQRSEIEKSDATKTPNRGGRPVHAVSVKVDKRSSKLVVTPEEALLVQLQKEVSGENQPRQKPQRSRVDPNTSTTNSGGGSNRQAPKHVSMFPTNANREFHAESNSYLLPAGSHVATIQHSLPAGTTRSKFADCEMVSVPAVQNQNNATKSRDSLVAISSLDDWAQLAFRDTTHLNHLQSKVFAVAYHTSHNMLVCAPTGAGKTNVAMLTILNCVGKYIVGGTLQRDSFKIIYVAPMKALAAEVTEKFSSKLQPLGLVVRELTGDMQLTKREIKETQIIVTTPEKWDVITRKSSDLAFVSIVRLLIIDEVHLLQEERGAVIETLVARTQRQVETTQSMIRIVGLSATLPNYMDVAEFLAVPAEGRFFFDASFRPVPLEQKFIGVLEKNPMLRENVFNEKTTDIVIDRLQQGHQVMVFVHARNATIKTAQAIVQLATQKNKLGVLAGWEEISEDDAYLLSATKFDRSNPKNQRKHTRRTDSNYDAKWAASEISKIKSFEIKQLVGSGLGCHHAGMLRSDRTIMERLFSRGVIRVLCCTATLAWGVNLPAHTVIIKGTSIYDAKQSKFVDLGILDVQQIFGRAGRPQFDTSGEGIIITPHDRLNHYLQLMCHQIPIESQFINQLADHLNAEIVLGTVTTVKEAIRWLSYTYLFIRMRHNPMAYGITYDQIANDPALVQHRTSLIDVAAKKLDHAMMIRYDSNSGTLSATDLGRVASHYYVTCETITSYNEKLIQAMDDAHVLEMICRSSEFGQVKVRDDELVEMEAMHKNACNVNVLGGMDNPEGKVNILLQSHISRHVVQGFALVSDSMYVQSNTTRLMRAVFEVVLKRGWTALAERLLSYCKMVELCMWDFEHPLRQFGVLPNEVVKKLEARHPASSLDSLRDMTAAEIGSLVQSPRYGHPIRTLACQFPWLDVTAEVQPISRTVLRVTATVYPDFDWSPKISGTQESWWVWVEDELNEHLYHSEYFTLKRDDYLGRRSNSKKQGDDDNENFRGGNSIINNTSASATSPLRLIFTMPIRDPLPPQYFLRFVSDRWIGCETVVPLNFRGLILPHMHPPHTELLNLQPLPLSALQEPRFMNVFKYPHFNPVQTQIFHVCYHTDHNVLLGAPTGSGKTVASELALLRLLRVYPNKKCVYIAPLKALVRERKNDWENRIVKPLGVKMIELTGDFTPDTKAIASADIILTTPEKWDGVSRSWQHRGYVQKVGLIVFDEIHLLGGDRGPVLEVIVSRMRYVSAHTDASIRLMGLSTALANAQDLAQWLGIPSQGLFNFKPSVRPVPLEVHMQGFPGKHYCPRMATMNKPAYTNILLHSPHKPVLVFVSSRRQTRLTALDLISFCVADEIPQRFLTMGDHELQWVLSAVHDPNLRHTLQFGIGLHHAGLSEPDRKLTEELFAANKIQVLVSTSTLAWGVNLPAHLVIVKGTEFFDAKLGRYVDMPITDVLQMMGRAGRPQFDSSAKACIFVHEPKKDFYRKFLYEPFPVESSLKDQLHNHINAEVASGTILSKQDAMDYLTWTYFYRRLFMNPSYYQLEDTTHETVSRYLSDLVEAIFSDLERSGCVELSDDNKRVKPDLLGRIASYYYLDYTTVDMFNDRLCGDSGDECLDVEDMLAVLCDASEYNEHPVRHNEDKLNADLAAKCPIGVDPDSLDDSHTKVHLLLQAHFSHIPLPIADYRTDTKSVLDQAIRILQAMIDVTADHGNLYNVLQAMYVVQMCVQAQWVWDNPIKNLPHMTSATCELLARHGYKHLPQVLLARDHKLSSLLSSSLSSAHLQQFMKVRDELPNVEVEFAWSSATVEADSDAFLSVSLVRRNQKPRFVHAPKFPKDVDEGWWLMLGEVTDDKKGEVIAMKRIAFQGGTTTKLVFQAPEEPGVYTWTLYLICDAYVGLDQEYEIDLCVVKPAVGGDDAAVVAEDATFWG